MKKVDLYCLKEIAAEFGVKAHTVSEVARSLGLEPKPMMNGKAKGFDDSDVNRLRRAFGRVRETAAAT